MELIDIIMKIEQNPIGYFILLIPHSVSHDVLKYCLRQLRLQL